MWILNLLYILPDRALPEPKFGNGYSVTWRDGSEGEIVKRLNYNDDWYYSVRLQKSGIEWSLPEKGLKLKEN